MTPTDPGMPLAGGTLQKLAPGSTPDQIVAAMNDIIDRLNVLLQTTVQADSKNRRYLNGFQAGGFPGGDFGMKISKPGVDVTAATDGELLFMWDYTTNTQYWRDPLTAINYLQIGTLPDGTGGWAVASPGVDVADGF